jgi:hypothetical protein
VAQHAIKLHLVQLAHTARLIKNAMLDQAPRAQVLLLIRQKIFVMRHQHAFQEAILIQLLINVGFLIHQLAQVVHTTQQV